MKHEVILRQETAPSYHAHALGRVATSALRLLPFQRRRQRFEQQFGTREARRAAHHNLESACAEQFAVAETSGKLISVPTPEHEGRMHDRIVFETSAPSADGERRLMIVDRHFNPDAAPMLQKIFNVSFYQPKEADGTRRGIQIGLSEPVADLGDVRYTEVTVHDDKTFELLAANPASSLSHAGSVDKGGLQLLSPDLANGMADAIRENNPVHPEFLREAMVVEQHLPELPAA